MVTLYHQLVSRIQAKTQESARYSSQDILLRLVFILFQRSSSTIARLKKRTVLFRTPTHRVWPDSAQWKYSPIRTRGLSLPNVVLQWPKSLGLASYHLGLWRCGQQLNSVPTKGPVPECTASQPYWAPPFCAQFSWYEFTVSVCCRTPRKIYYCDLYEPFPLKRRNLVLVIF